MDSSSNEPLLEENNAPSVSRKIRSFVRREGRLTPSQQRAIDNYWSQFGIDYNESPLDFNQCFGRANYRTLEIGFGDGEGLIQQAQNNPGRDYMGIEVHTPGVGHLLLRIGELGLHNIRVSNHDAIEVLAHQIPDQSVDCVQLFFPDPWPKKRHHKRRILRLDLIDQVSRILTHNGYFHLATDWEHYAHEMMAVMTASPGFANTQAEGEFSPRPSTRPETKFERRGLKKGHGVWDLVFAKTV